MYAEDVVGIRNLSNGRVAKYTVLDQELNVSQRFWQKSTNNMSVDCHSRMRAFDPAIAWIFR